MSQGFDPYSIGLLDFAGTRYKGAEISVNLDVPMGDYLNFSGLTLLADEAAWFVEHALFSWNLERRGNAIPATAEGMAQLSIPFQRLIIGGWVKAAAEPSVFLAETSNAGDSSVAE